MVRGGREQIVLIGDAPVDRPAAGRQPRRERAKSQGAFALGVQKISIAVSTIRSFESASARRSVHQVLAVMSTVLTSMEQRSNRRLWNDIPIDP